ncbi:MAG TPA: peptide-methionine (R)-S-oxide reductase MsrB [Pyrinomonadaceae bacterium]|nr:peptide-methionine (R)-S-oxide reductase MsrB [Pyrinomonadaceae bacterium]
MDRRFFLQSAAALGAAALAPEWALALATNDQKSRKGKGEPLTKIIKSDEEWKRVLTPEQYRVTRQAGTEAPYSSPLNEEHGRGVFECVGCELPLFNSAAKFDSHTGWPSFFAPISKRNVVEHVDNTLGMSRTEVLCARCDAHLGHVFDDGPRPTGLRYCMNGVALKFVKGS